jgi:hypothetical protein
MKRTIINLVIAVPLATAALTMTPGVALADDGPIIVLPPSEPGDGPDDKDGPHTDPVDPTGPGDITAPQPCPTHGGGAECVPDGGDKPGDQPGDKPGDPGKPQGGDKPATQVESIALPTRIDAGVAPATDDSLELSWVLAGGALVTASGAAFAARRVRNRA